MQHVQKDVYFLRACDIVTVNELKVANIVNIFSFFWLREYNLIFANTILLQSLVSISRLCGCC